MDFSPVADQRVVAGAAATLEVFFTDQDGEPGSASGAVTVGITRGDGSVLVAPGAATVNDTGNHPGRYTYALTAAQTALVDLLTATWTDSAGGVRSTLVDVVGGVYFSVAEARAGDGALTISDYPPEKIVAVRREVEEECERITGCAWVPRYRRYTLDGSGLQNLVLPDTWAPRVVRSVRVYQDATNYTQWTTSQLSHIYLDITGVLRLIDGTYWPPASDHWAAWQTPQVALRPGNITIEVEHGFDRPPADLKRACLIRLADRLNVMTTAIPQRATSFVPAGGGGNFRLDQASGWKTGIPDVDGPYERHCKRVAVIA